MQRRGERAVNCFLSIIRASPELLKISSSAGLKLHLPSVAICQSYFPHTSPFSQRYSVDLPSLCSVLTSSYFLLGKVGSRGWGCDETSLCLSKDVSYSQILILWGGISQVRPTGLRQVLHFIWSASCMNMPEIAIKRIMWEASFLQCCLRDEYVSSHLHLAPGKKNQAWTQVWLLDEWAGFFALILVLEYCVPAPSPSGLSLPHVPFLLSFSSRMHD